MIETSTCRPGPRPAPARSGVRVGRLHGVGARPRACGSAPTRTRDNALAGHYAQRLLEVLSGHRVCDQLAALATEEVFDDVRTLVRRRLLRAPGDVRPVLGRVFDDSPAPGVLEVTATVGVGDRVELLAFRLEQRGTPRRPETTTWRFTALETRW
ncbi:Rv3235 family protein [Streptacidiphilus cavernicola]|uniref:Rv3235 family protein n=1 Tax=Streptacidiphilus cavernicola TaxID=3342716 RepID=A0ABV6VZS6_9ACTN